MNQEKIGQLIKKLRVSKKMTQKELGDKLGVTDRAISRWERGIGMPDYSLITSLCRELDISIDELLDGKREVKNSKFFKKIIIVIFGIIILLAIFIFGDYLMIQKGNIPIFYRSKEYFDNMIIYYAPFCNVYRVNYDTRWEYIIVDNKKEYDKDTIPNMPFNYHLSGINNMLKYQDKISIDTINSLPLSEYYPSIKRNGDTLDINYLVEDRFIKEDYYLERSLFYNGMMLLVLDRNIEKINFYFLNDTYHLERSKVKEIFDLSDMENKYLDLRVTFIKYVEPLLNNDEVIAYYYKAFFLDSYLDDVEKIIVYDSTGNKVIKTINDLSKVREFTNILKRGMKLLKDANITMEGNAWKVSLLKENVEIFNFEIFYNGCFGRDGKEYIIDKLDGKRFIKILE